MKPGVVYSPNGTHARISSEAMKLFGKVTSKELLPDAEKPEGCTSSEADKWLSEFNNRSNPDKKGQ